MSQSADDPTRAGGACILLVGANPVVLADIARVLTHGGYGVLQGRHGGEAWSQVAERRPRLVIIDIEHPVPDIRALLARLRSAPASGEPAVLFLTTTRPGDVGQADALDAGADGYLIRPIADEHLLARVRAQLRQCSLTDRLRASEARFRALIQGQADAVLVVDGDGVIRFANPAAVELFAKPATTLVGTPFGFPVEGEDQVELEVLREGQLLVVEMRLAPTAWDGDAAWIASLRDITERKRTEELLAQAQRIARLGSWHLELDSGRRQWSEETFRIFGLVPHARSVSDGEFLGRIHPDDLTALQVARDRALAGEAPFDFEHRVVRPNGEVRWVHERGELQRDLQGRPQAFSGTVLDITARRELDERLQQSERLEAVGQLTGGVAHDFNNLLTVILGNAEILSDELASSSPQAALAEMIAGAAQRGAELTQRLLAFARKQALEPKVVDVNRLVTDMDALLRRTLGENVEVDLSREPALWQALIDPGQLESALLNLCINARDAMPDGGRLTIETANVELDADYARHNVEVVPGQYVRIAVSDTGTGIAPDDLPRLFEPFFTTKPIGRGTGLGLPMVYGFVKQSGGHISVYSEPGEGTTIKLYLPRRPGDAALAATGDTPDEDALEGGTETILVVEDDELVRRYACRQLGTLGYRVIAAPNALTALDVLKGDDDIALLFTDMVMPGGMSGRQLADVAQSLRPRLGVLYTSGYTQDAVVHQGRLDDGVLLLSKPYRRAELARLVRRALRQGGPA